VDVLIVEDEEHLRASLAEGLGEALGCSVVAAASAEEAEKLLTSSPPRLVVSDVRLPGKDGVQLLLTIRARWPETPFIFISAHPSSEARELASGRAIQFVGKPFAFSDIMEAAERALEGSQFSGSVGGISLIDLLQVLHLGRRTSAVTVRRRGTIGTIWLADGEVVHAEVGDLRGRAAFGAVIAWQAGTFGSDPGSRAPEQSIEEPFNALLLDALRVQDEEGEGAAAPEFSLADADVDPSSLETDASEWIARTVEALPGCVAAACIDIEFGRATAFAPVGALPSEIAERVSAAAASLLLGERLAALDRCLSGAPTAGASQRAPVREVLASSDDWVHFFQRVQGTSGLVLAVVCPASSSLGTVVAKARAWLRSHPPGASG